MLTFYVSSENIKLFHLHKDDKPKKLSNATWWRKNAEKRIKFLEATAIDPN